MTALAVKKLSAAVQKRLDKVLKKAGYSDTIEVGDIFFTDKPDTIIRITRIRQDSNKRDGKHLMVHYDSNDDYECTRWSSYGSSELSKFLEEYGEYKLNKPLAEYMKEALEVIEGKRSAKDYEDQNQSSESSDTALMSTTNKDVLVALTKDLEEKKKTALMLERAVALEMEKRKAELEEIRERFAVIVKDFQKKVEKIRKVIGTIELYLGIQEQIIQIQSGNPAGIEEPITLRQKLLYMDLEVGEPGDDDEGLDFKNIEDFDNWSLSTSEEHPKHLIPPATLRSYVTPMHISDFLYHYNWDMLMSAWLMFVTKSKDRGWKGYELYEIKFLEGVKKISIKECHQTLVSAIQWFNGIQKK